MTSSENNPSHWKGCFEFELLKIGFIMMIIIDGHTSKWILYVGSVQPESY